MAEEGDAQEFVGIVNTIMSQLMGQYKLDDKVYVKVKNWFDHKWLNFSGNRVVPFDGGGADGIQSESLESAWRKEKVSIPPFNPNRIISYKYLVKKGYSDLKSLKPVHAYRDSNENIHNRIEDYTSNGIVIWFSSNSETNQRGSLMAYIVRDETVTTWYASVENIKGWRITKSKGISLDELKSYTKSNISFSK